VTADDIEFVILAAGRSTRNYPHSKGIPHKSLVPFGSRKVIDHIVGEPIAAGLKRIAIVVSDDKARESFELCFKREKDIEDKFAKSGNIIGLELLQSLYLPEDVSVRYVIQSQPRGIGHAIGLVAAGSGGRHLAVRLPDDIVLAKDKSVVGLALKRYIGEAAGGNLLLTRRVSDPSRWGIIENGIFLEKPAQSSSNEAFHSLAILDALVCERLIGEAAKTFEGELHFCGALNAAAAEDPKMKIRAMPLEPGENYLDCGTLAGYEEALIYMLMNESPYKQNNRAVAKRFLNG